MLTGLSGVIWTALLVGAGRVERLVDRARPAREGLRAACSFRISGTDTSNRGRKSMYWPAFRGQNVEKGPFVDIFSRFWGRIHRLWAEIPGPHPFVPLEERTEARSPACGVSWPTSDTGEFRAAPPKQCPAGPEPLLLFRDGRNRFNRFSGCRLPIQRSRLRPLFLRSRAPTGRLRARTIRAPFPRPRCRNRPRRFSRAGRTGPAGGRARCSRGGPTDSFARRSYAYHAADVTCPPEGIRGFDGRP